MSKGNTHNSRRKAHFSQEQETHVTERRRAKGRLWLWGAGEAQTAHTTKTQRVSGIYDRKTA